MKKITLVNPPFVYFPKNERARYNYCRPPLGLAYLAAYLEKRRPGAFEIKIVDTLIEKRAPEEWIGIIRDGAPDIVGFSVVTPTAGGARRMVAELRKHLPGAVFVAGGPHSTVRPLDLFPGFDAAVVGEGERTFLEIADAAAAGNSFSGIKGAAFAGGGDVPPEPREFIQPLDEIPPPARGLLRKDAYYHSFPYRHSGYFTTMFTARGCPNNCYFCGNEALWRRKIRFHSMDYVAAELESLARDNYTLIFLDDDDFLAVKSRAMEICALIRRTNPRMKWICHSCAKSIDGESLAEMKRSGCVEVQVGVESGSEEVLADIPKCSGKELVAENFRLLKKHRINSWATFIIGHRLDSEKTVKETVEFAVRLDPDYASFIMLLPFPGSRAFDYFKESGLLKTENWDDYTWHGDPVFETPELDAAALVRLRGYAQKRFYLRPVKLLKLLIHTLGAGSLREMLRNFYAWFSIVKRQ